MSGTGYEIHPNGSKVTRSLRKITMTIVTNDEYCHIHRYQLDIPIDKGLRIRVNAEGEIGNNYNIEVGNNGSNVNVEVNGGNINLTTLK